jgi:hypothetical protein
MDERGARRREMIRALAASGALGAAGLGGVISRALAKGDLPPGVHQLDGSATVNAKPGAGRHAVEAAERAQGRRGVR